EAAEYFLAHHHHRGEAASAHAAQRIEREQAVGGRFAHFDAELAFEFVEYLLRPADVAGRPHADRYRILAFRLHGEERIERHHAVDLCRGNVQFEGYQFLHLLGQVTEPALHGMQDVYQFAGVVAVLPADGFYLIDSLLRHTYLFHTLWLLLLGIGGTWCHDRFAVVIARVQELVRAVAAGRSEEVPVKGLDVGIL